MRVMDRGNGYPEIEVYVDIDLDGMSLTEIDAYLDEHAQGLRDVSLRIETEPGWEGGTYLRQSLKGWREATETERREAAREREAALQQQRHYENQQAERLRKARPDLFR